MPLPRAALIALLLTGLPPAVPAAEYPPTGVEMTLQRVSEHGYYVQGQAGTAIENEGFVSNAGVVVTDAGVVVIDALGTPSLAWKLLETIRTVTDRPVVKVLVTHYHADHILGLQVFRDQGAEVVAPAGAERYLNAPVARERLEERRFSLDPWVNDATRLVWPDRYVADEERFSLGGVEFRLTVVGDAHSDADMTVFVENDRVLYSGDVIFEGRVPFLGSTNTRLWLETLRRMDSSGLAALVPGHGAHQAAPVESIGLTYRYLAHLRATMGAAVEELTPFDEAYRAADWSEFEHLPAFAEANRRNAYQVYLSMQNELFE